MVEITGTDGADSLEGTVASDLLSGGAGDDVIVGGGGSDSIDGGSGDDHVVVEADDFAVGGEGMDTLEIDLVFESDGFTIDLSAMWDGGSGAIGSGSASGFEYLSLIIGSSGNDVVTIGTPGTGTEEYRTMAWGMGGDDWLTGGGDRDRLFGQSGDDLLVGLAGDDLLWGRDGSDRIEGGAGDDAVSGGGGADVLIGGAGSDTYQYFNGDDPGADQIVEAVDEGGTDAIEIWPYLTAVDDSAFAASIRNIEVARLISLTNFEGPEFVLGAAFQATGIATVVASADVDASQTTSGIEFVVTLPNRRPLTVTGGSGDDSFRFGEATLPAWINDYVLAGGEGFDTLWLDYGTPLSLGSAQVWLSGFEAIVIVGGATEDALAPSAASLVTSVPSYSVVLTNDMMDAGTQFTVDARQLGFGTPTLLLDVSQLTLGRAVKVLAGDAPDALTGSVGKDALFGGGGNDVLRGGAGADLLDGGAGADTLQGGSGYDTLRGGLGDDTFVVNAGDKVIENGGSGTDTVKSPIDFILPVHVEKLILTGSAGASGRGNDGDNMITGNLANNILHGSGGNDVIDGGAGNDRINGGTGSDRLSGGHGLDRFLFDAALGSTNVDQILDFSAPDDTIFLARTVFTSAG
ncbi:MAG: hypothetical protein M3177_07390, partial [Pseudomonadota bacterium]|nr:hypothetical protein [Pseudomonadota bacterium]